MAAIQPLLDIMKSLRDPDTGCPWDVKQTFASIAPYTLEEAYEVVDAIEREQPQELCNELGDLLLQVVFHSQIASEQDLFDFSEVVQRICAKLTRRHPHVFGDTVAVTSDDVKANWHQIKQQERGPQASVLDGIPKHLPALKKAQKMGSNAAQFGFDWSHWSGALEKLHEEIGEFDVAVEKYSSRKEAAAHHAEVSEELGDMLFCVVNLCRHFQVDAEAALNQTNRKFARRFRYVEQQTEQAEPLTGRANADRLERFWRDIKNME